MVFLYLLQVGPEDKIRCPEARQHGLTMSLLTRLHRHYAQISKKDGVKDSPLVRRFTANLLTNYRCDAGVYICLCCVFGTGVV